MAKNFTLKAVTLLEMLIVMTISAGGFFGIVESMRQISYARLATNGAKAVVNLVRTTKHQSMLLRLLPDEPWIYGMGVKFYRIHDNSSSYWIAERIKYKAFLDSTGYGTLYQKYPDTPPGINDLESVAKSSSYVLTEKVVLEPRIKLYFYDKNGDLEGGNETPKEFYILFESLTGVPHFYTHEGNASKLSALINIDGFLILFAPSSSVLYIGKDSDIYLAPIQTFNLKIPNNK